MSAPAPATEVKAPEVKKIVVAIAAPSGLVGTPITRGFVEHPSYTTRLLTTDEKDKEGKPKFAEHIAKGAQVVKVDYTNVDSLAKALEGVDIVVSAVGGNGLLDSQLKLIEASVKAKVRRFVPSEFGFDGRHVGAAEPLFSIKSKVREAVEKAGLEYTYVGTGFFQEFFVNAAGIFDIKQKKINIPGSEETRVSIISIQDIGTLLPEALLVPESKNQYISLLGETFSYAQLAAFVEEQTGEKFTKVVTPASEFQSRIDSNPNKWATLFDFFNLQITKGYGVIEEKDSFNHAHIPDFRPRSVHAALTAITAPARKIQVAVVGGSGIIGEPIVDGFLAHGHYKTTVLRQAEVKDEKNKAKNEAYAKYAKKGAIVKEVDFKNADALAKVLEGIDVVVSSVGVPGLVDTQLALLAASIKSKVRRFVPSEFGVDVKKVGYLEPLFSLKKPIVDAIEKAGSAIEFTYVHTGFFTEYLTAPAAGVLDLVNTTLLVPGSEQTRFTHTSVHDIGNLLPLALLHPSSKNAAIDIVGETVSYGEVSQILHALHGTKFTHKTLSEADLQKAWDDAAPPKWSGIPALFGLIQAKGQAVIDVKESFGVKHVRHFRPLTIKDHLHQVVRTHKRKHHHEKHHGHKN